MQQSAISPEFFCDVQPDRERVIVALGGELDLAAAPQLAATVDELLDVGFGRIVVDLRPLTFLDSGGVPPFFSPPPAPPGRGAPGGAGARCPSGAGRATSTASSNSPRPTRCSTGRPHERGAEPAGS